MNQVNTQYEIAIIDYGLKCISGNTDFGLFGAVAGNLVCSKADPIFEAPTQYGEAAAPIISCPIPELHHITEVSQRMFECLRDALIDTFDRLLDNKQSAFVINEKILIYIIIPAESTERSNLIIKKQWLADLCESEPNFSKCKYHFGHANTGLTNHFHIANEQLKKQQFDTVVFCGVDSLFDEATCEQLGMERRLQTTKNADGIILGEAAACIVLERYNKLSNIKNTDSKKQPLAIISAISNQPEPFAGKPHKHKLVGQRNAISACLQKEKLKVDDLEIIIHTTGGERATPMEWYQTTQALWPNKLPEAQRVAYQLREIERPILKPRKMPEELNLGLTVGDVGAASIPLGLILACARFEFNYPEAKNCLINEANDFLHRGAILVLNPKSRAKELHQKNQNLASPQQQQNTIRRKKHG